MSGSTKQRGVVELQRADRSWEGKLSKRESGGNVTYAATAKNIALILQNHPRWADVLAYDVRADRMLLRRAPPFCESSRRSYPCELTDTDEALVSIWLEDSCFAIFVAPNSPALRAGVSVAAQRNRFDPVLDFLATLVWDGRPRIDRLCVDYFGAHDTPLNAAFGAKWMISAVARAFEPGCKADHVLTLEGPQGIGKSSGIQSLAGAPFYGDNLPNVLSKDAAIYLQGMWIVELAELDALSRVETSTEKSFVSRRDDRFRPPYGGRAVTHPRRVVFAATTNEQTFLKDSTGNRRHWPVSVHRVDVSAIAHDRDQLWAEAVHRYRSGEPWHLLEPHLVMAALAEQERRLQADPWEEPIRDFLASLGAAGVTSVEHILTRVLHLDVGRRTRSDGNRVARMLQRAGYIRHQKGSGKTRKWHYSAAGAAVLGPSKAGVETPLSPSSAANISDHDDVLASQKPVGFDGDNGVSLADLSTPEDVEPAGAEVEHG